MEIAKKAGKGNDITSNSLMGNYKNLYIYLDIRYYFPIYNALNYLGINFITLKGGKRVHKLNKRAL